MAALWRMLDQPNSIDTYPPLPKPKKPKRDVVAERAAHAAEMLKKAKRRLKLAKTVHKKWATRVRYYERAAAKRGSK